MNGIKTILKRIIPQVVRDYIRNHRDYAMDLVMNVGKKDSWLLYFGKHLYYTKGMAIIARVRAEKVFERELCESLASELNKHKEPVLFDVGANIGLISLAVLAKVPQVRIHAFEPGPHQANLLQKTIRTNGLGNQIELHEVALGKKDGTLEFFAHAPRHASKDGFKDTGRGDEGSVIQVAASTLDSWWKAAGKPHVSVIKIDTEGAEPLILAGAVECLATEKPTLYLEVDARNLAPYNLTPDAVRSWFAEHGYTLSTLEGVTCSEQNFNELLTNNDTFIARPISL